MGIIKRQGFKATLFNYIGVLVAAISTFLIYSREKELYGLYQFLFSSGTLLSPFILMGASDIAVKYHPRNNNAPQTFKGLLLFLMMLLGLGMLIGSILFLSFKDELRQLLINENDDPLLRKYLFFSFPFAILLAFNNLLSIYISNFGRIVVPTISNTLWVKIALPVLVLLAGLGWITIQTYVYATLAMLATTSVMLLLYLMYIKGVDLSWPHFLKDSKLRNQIIRYGLFAALNMISMKMTWFIDTVMIGKMIDLTNSGAYRILVFLVNIMLIPRDALYRIGGPIISRAIAKSDSQEVDRIYKSSSLILLTAGAGILGLILINVHDLIAILPDKEEFVGFFAVVVFMGIAKWFEMATSLNTHIIIYSSYYRFNLYALFSLAIVNIWLNYIFIGWYGIAGAALANLVALSTYNLLKLIYIQWRFQTQPFTTASLKVFTLGLLVFAIVFFLPKTNIPLLDIAIRSLLFTPLFAGPILYFRWVPEWNDLLQSLWHRARKFLP